MLSSFLLLGSAVQPKAPSDGGAAAFPFLYQENSLNAVAQGVSILQGNGYYDSYALVLNTVPFADLHQALSNTLIEPVEPISHLVSAGIFGTGALPPFNPVTAAGEQLPGTGLPTFIATPSTAKSTCGTHRKYRWQRSANSRRWRRQCALHRRTGLVGGQQYGCR